MQITVKLQDMFSYSPIMVFVYIILVIVFVVVYWPRKKKELRKQEIPKAKVIPAKSIMDLKNKYIKILTDIEIRHSENKITDRMAYQELSALVRNFVFEVTGIKVQNYTLEDIKKANLPKLYELIAECYVPEFAAENNSNVQDSIKRARKVIGEWN